jgi:hypothetical protein
LRAFGTDSRLFFTAPRDGEYLVRITDTRGFGGADYKYELTIRAPRPDFNVGISGAGATVNRGSGKTFELSASRADGLDGEITVEITGMPDGFSVTSPLTIEAGHLRAQGAVYATPDAAEPAADAWEKVRVKASAVVDGKPVVKSIGNLGKLKLADRPNILFTLSPPGKEPAAPGEVAELTISPGQTVAAKLRVQRIASDGVLSFGKESAGLNLPHGVYVDNVGLNGILLLPGQTERDVFITADDWVSKTTRLFFLKSDQEEAQCCPPVLLRVK